MTLAMDDGDDDYSGACDVSEMLFRVMPHLVPRLMAVLMVCVFIRVFILFVF